MTEFLDAHEGARRTWRDTDRAAETRGLYTVMYLTGPGAETLNEAANRLQAGEQVSGPAADRFIAGVNDLAANFQGQYLTPKHAAKLRHNPLLGIYDNGEQMLACCYDAANALCHPENQRSPDLAAAPDLARCVSGCANGARTDTHIEQLKIEQAWHQQQTDAEITPEPLRQRHRQRVAALEQIAAEHLATRRMPESCCDTGDTGSCKPHAGSIRGDTTAKRETQ